MGWVSAAIGLAKFGAGVFGANREKKVADEQVELGHRDNLEDIRRRKFEQEQTQGAAKAFSENAGVKHTGGSSAQGFLDTMRSQFKQEIEWMQTFADESRRLGHKGARVNRQTGIFGAISGGLNTGLSVYGATKKGG